MSESQPETIRNRQTMSERQALFRRFGYDSAASLKFILAKILPLPGHVLEIGTGKGGFLAQLGKHADHITTLDIDADQQRLAKRHVRQAGPRCPIRYVIHDAERLPWADGSFDSVVSVNTFHDLERPTRVFAQQGVQVRAGEPGATAEALAAAYLNGQLVNEPAGCTHHQHDEEGGHYHHDTGHHHEHE